MTSLYYLKSRVLLNSCKLGMTRTVQQSSSTTGELPVPMPSPGEVRVRIHASGVNPSDVKSRGGFYTPLFSELFHTVMEQVSLTVGEGVDQLIENGFDLECSVETGIWNSRSICRAARRASGSTPNNVDCRWCD